MKALPWIAAGVGIGFAVYVAFNQPPAELATGSDGVEDAARRTSFWGTKQRIGGVGRDLVGRLKEGVGRAAGNDQLAGEGVVDQVAGAVKNRAGGVAEAAGNLIHDLNR